MPVPGTVLVMAAVGSPELHTLPRSVKSTNCNLSFLGRRVASSIVARRPNTLLMLPQAGQTGEQAGVLPQAGQAHYRDGESMLWFYPRLARVTVETGENAGVLPQAGQTGEQAGVQPQAGLGHYAGWGVLHPGWSGSPWRWRSRLWSIIPGMTCFTMVGQSRLDLEELV